MDKPIPGVKCPKCKGPVTYNGNYFCLDFGNECDWALPHTSGMDGRIPKWYREWAVLAYSNLMLSRGKEPQAHVIASLRSEGW